MVIQLNKIISGWKLYQAVQVN